MKYSPSPIESEVRRVRALLEAGRFADALNACRVLMERVPENRDVLYMLAVSQRYVGQVQDALATLADLEGLHPRFSRLFQERGHCHVLRRDPTAALEAFSRAVTLNAALPGSWKALQLLFRSVGLMEDADKAAAQLLRFESLPTAVVTASGMYADGETFQAEHLIRQFLRVHPNHIEATRLLAKIRLTLTDPDEAEQLLERILESDPEDHATRYSYVMLLLDRQRYKKALAEARILRSVDPDDRNYRTVYAAASIALGHHEEGLREYRALCADAPQAAGLHVAIGHVLKVDGRQQQAIDSYRAALAASPSHGDAYWSLANLKTYRFADGEMAAMRRLEADEGTSTIDRYHLCFALGKALEDRGNHAESFHYYERGNALKKTETQYRPELIERNTTLQSAVCTRDFFNARPGFGCIEDDPIFIVGLPRAGSTLLEQILASHSAVEGTMELPEIAHLVHSLQGHVQYDAPPRYPGVLADLTAEDSRKLGERYLADTRVYRTGKRFFIDKMPNNFRHIGLIHLILPNARIIDARREPMACCFSNFKQLFASGQEFTYSLDDIARYYLTYVELMSHWDRALPGRILRVNHEDVVADLDHSVRRLLDFCELDFEPACLEFHKNPRSVRTASSEQVRKPIFTQGLDQWRHYEEWLQPLRQALGPIMPGSRWTKFGN
jgi:tetratricopeptide (TPR) repeat protein